MTRDARDQLYRVEFKLSMPGRASWNGGWSGEGKNYSIVKQMTDDGLARLGLEASGTRSWTHRWSDGWVAEVSARVVPADETLPKSDGFCGYDWMIENILRKGSPYGEVTS